MKYLFILTFILQSLITCAQSSWVTYLDSLEFGEIVNLYGPPYKNQSFDRQKLNINGKIFEHGLGTHAPANLTIDLQGKAAVFSAFIGIDSVSANLFDEKTRGQNKHAAGYVYDNLVNHYDVKAGGTVIFRVLLDGKVAFESGPVTHNHPPVAVTLDVSGAKKITLVADPTADGSYADYANWADAKIVWKNKPNTSPLIYNYPGEVLVNHIGFVPRAYKTCYIWGKEPTKFNLVNSKNNKKVFTGTLVPATGDLGDYLLGDFSEFSDTGFFYIETQKKKSEVFEIADDVYQKALKSNIRYISNQRSGDPSGGWTKGEHLDDGIRQDNDKFQDVTGGWYDAC